MRLPGRLKYGYYPTPTRVIDMVARMLAPNKSPDRSVWLDPTCGEGYALAGLAQRVGNRPLLHGVEWDTFRAKESQDRLDDVLQADMNTVIFPKHGYDLVWFNPPYDWARFKTQETKDAKRESEIFFRSLFGYNSMIQHTNNVLIPGGIFIGVLPATDLQYLVYDLWRHFQGPEDDSDEGRSYPLIYQFPDPEYEEFGQYVVLGRKRKRTLSGLKEEVKAAVIDGIEHETHPRLTWVETPLFQLPGVPKLQIGNMRTRIYDPANGVQVAMKYGFAARPAITARYWPSEPPPLQPVLPLQDAHMAQLIASGGVNAGKIFDTRPEGGKAYVLRGRSMRTTQLVSEEFDEDGNRTKWVEREVYVTEIMTIDEDGQPMLYKVKEVAPADKPSDKAGVVAEVASLAADMKRLNVTFSVNDTNERIA